MSIKKLLTVSAIGLAMGIISTTATAEGDGFVENYVNNSYGEIWKNSFGECWRDRFAETDVRLEECGYEVKKAAGVPEVMSTGGERKPAAPVCPDVIVLQNLHFAFDSSVVADEDKEKLAAARDFVNATVPQGCSRTETVDVVGHTDSTGPEAYNDKLSLRRAEAVVNHLRSIGVTINMNAIGKGEYEPVADNATKDGRAQNRRVVVDINTAN